MKQMRMVYFCHIFPNRAARANKMREREWEQLRTLRIIKCQHKLRSSNGGMSLEMYILALGLIPTKVK